MHAELQSKMLEIVTSMQDNIVKTKDFAMEQLPSIANEYIMFNRVYLTISMILIVAFATILSLWGRKLIRDTQASYDRAFFSRLAAIILSTITAIIFLVGIRDFILVWVSPKIFLIEALLSAAHKL